MSSNSPDMLNVAKSLIEQKVIFLVGTGMSYESDMPMFTSVAEELLQRQLADKEVTRKQLRDLTMKFGSEAISAWYIQTLPEPKREKFPEELKTILGEKNCRPNKAHTVIEYFFAEGLIDRLYTTNWDLLIEKCVGSAAIAVTDKNINNLEKIKKDGLAVIHIHGNLEENTGITEEQTYSIDTECFSEFVREFRLNDYIVLIGHSFNDQDIRQAFFQAKTKAKRFPQFIAVGKTDDKLEKIVADGVWKARGFHYYPDGATSFLEELENKVIIARKEEAYKKLSSEFGSNPMIVREKAEEIEQTFEIFQEGDGIRYLARTFFGDTL